MDESAPRDILTKSQVADWLQVSERTVENWVKKGFPAFWVNHTIRFLREEILKYIREQNEK